jgi:hypothetical protein
VPPIEEIHVLPIVKLNVVQREMRSSLLLDMNRASTTRRYGLGFFLSGSCPSLINSNLKNRASLGDIKVCPQSHWPFVCPLIGASCARTSYSAPHRAQVMFLIVILMDPSPGRNAAEPNVYLRLPQRQTKPLSLLNR